jgi:phosphoserine phosphatase RsbU/P
LVLTAALKGPAGLDGVTTFARRFAPLPLVSVGMALPNLPSVTVDNESGMAAAVAHLVEHHGARRVLFLGGPAANGEAQQRRGAYQRVLERNKIDYDPAWVLPGTFMASCAAPALQEFWRKTGVKPRDVDALVAANDNMALGALDELRAAGLNVPDDLAVVGFDDTEEAQLSQPTLTTVRQPLERLGLEALRHVRRHRDLTPTDLELRVETELRIRQSCGCLDGLTIIDTADSMSAERGVAAALLSHRTRIEAELSRAARGLLSPLGANWEHALLSGLIEDVLNAENERFMPILRRFVGKLSAGGVDLDIVDEVITCLRSELVPLVRVDGFRAARVEDLFQTARLLNGRAAQRTLRRSRAELRRWSRNLAEACNALSRCGDFAELRDAVHRHVRALGIKSVYLCVYDTPDDPGAGHLIAAYGASVVTAREGLPFHAPQLLPDELSQDQLELRSYAILPLLGADTLAGHVFFEYGPELVMAYAALADAMSTCILTVERRRG